MKLKQQPRAESRGSRTETVKRYEPVREFERQTSYCPLYLAWRIVDEARNYFRTELIPSSGSATLTRSRPLARPSRAFASQIPFAAPQAAQVSHPMGEGQLADKLARRAEAVFAKHALSPSQWRRGNGRGGASKFTPLSGSLPVERGESERLWLRRFRNRECILAFMRHWLAGVLAKENPVLFRQLPESFKVGLPLPQKPCSSGRQSAPSNQSRFTSAATKSRAGSRGSAFARLRRDRHSPHYPVKPSFVHGCELLAI